MKPMNEKRRIRAMEMAELPKNRNPIAVALMLRAPKKTIPDKKKENKKFACRAKNWD